MVVNMFSKQANYHFRAWAAGLEVGGCDRGRTVKKNDCFKTLACFVL